MEKPDETEELLQSCLNILNEEESVNSSVESATNNSSLLSPNNNHNISDAISSSPLGNTTTTKLNSDTTDDITPNELSTFFKALTGTLNNASNDDPTLFNDLTATVNETPNTSDSTTNRLFTQTMQSLSENAKKVESEQPQSDESNEQLLKQILDQFENTPQLQDMMEGVMKQLMDKDILYEPMKEMKEKYPDWLTQNKDKLSSEDYQRYLKQFDYVKKICAAYETESDNFQTVLQLMQEMQECGKPPIEIVKELAPGIELGPEGLPNMFGNMDEKNANCSIM